MIFEHWDTKKIYFIPKNLCEIELFHLDGNLLTLSTGETIAFRTPNGAEEALCFIEECIRDNGTQMFYHEASSSYCIWYN